MFQHEKWTTTKDDRVRVDHKNTEAPILPDSDINLLMRDLIFKPMRCVYIPVPEGIE